ncbi:Uncharacterized protein dnl_50270 [Desulfonema limicola]|uniref:Uncharacterized protein n=1 Tax=Desulfonema limicola TaxID=45656 RepID=A0A975GIK2_9BACT|nr:Uncharacterized protein dnl_50270 [Desulfonema limicola]
MLNKKINVNIAWEGIYKSRQHFMKKSCVRAGIYFPINELKNKKAT